MKEINLTKGLKTIVDGEDYKILSARKWRALKCRNTFYAVSDCGDNLLYMHRILCPGTTNQSTEGV